ncbi:sulfotransferase domain-containing protein [Roseobacter ponti]|uniref:Sulfotransferase domain-containing protein n=1 Tax=Roseobacter ponti TaxID=1891787 RepID=A0A858SV58_9RHOB|nr:sulfotransferase domain-containing protein [Roseobacter ponti]QJF52575.1 sulfotransferase domain-containing protein [Roseobacter ponti]
MLKDASEIRPAQHRYSGKITDPDRWALYAPRRGDIIVCTPAKCGTTWTQSIIALLLNGGHDLNAPVTHISPWIDADFEDAESEAAPGRLAARPGRRVIKTHTPGDGFPVWDGVHVVAVYRHPLDVVLSLRKHLMNMVRISDHPMKEALPAALRYFLQAPFSPDDVDTDALKLLTEHYRRTVAARPGGQVTVLHYADMIADHAGTVARLARVLGIDADEEAQARVVAATAFTSMKRRAADFAPQGGTGLWKNDTAFFDSGGTEKWRGVFSEADLAAFEARLAELVPEPGLRHWLQYGGACAHGS